MYQELCLALWRAKKNGTRIFKKSKLQFCSLPLAFRPDPSCQSLSPNTAALWLELRVKTHQGLVLVNLFFIESFIANLNLLTNLGVKKKTELKIRHFKCSTAIPT